MSKRQLRAHAIAARAQAERPEDPVGWLSEQTRAAEEEIARLRELLRVYRLGQRKLDRVVSSEEVDRWTA